MNHPVLNPNDPDYFIEEFWYGFKNSMVNFYQHIKKNYDHIFVWSDNLNKLKDLKDYVQIESTIRDYISLYSFDLIKYSNTNYHDELLITNIKRWNKISTKFVYVFNFNNKNKNLNLKSPLDSKILLLFKIYLEIKKDMAFELLYELESVETIIKNDSYDKFIIWSLTNEKSKILELLSFIPNYNLEQNIKRLYPDFNFVTGTKSIKLCQLFRKKYLE